MEELKQKEKMGLRRYLEYTFIFVLILSGNILDLSDRFFDTPIHIFLNQQDMVREFTTLGLSLLAYTHIPYKNIKTKVFSFMFVIWAVIIILHNNFYDLYPGSLSFILYGCYILWIARIALIRNKKENRILSLKQLEKAGVAYNILMPVNTFRGLLQILLVPWKNPLYETRFLVANHSIIGVNRKRFIAKKYEYKNVVELVDKGGKIRLCKKYGKKEINKLIGRKIILGIRDCKRLEL